MIKDRDHPVRTPMELLIKKVMSLWMFCHATEILTTISLYPYNVKATFVQSTQLLFLKLSKPCHVGIH